MSLKIVKSLIYFIFSAVFVSTTAFFINENYSLRIYLYTFNFTLLNYTWVIILFTQFIYIYRNKGVNLANIYLITTISIIVILVISSVFKPFDYTSLSRNSIKGLFINRSNFDEFNITNNYFVRDFITKVRLFNPKIIYYILNPALLYFWSNRSNNSSFVLSLIFCLELIVLIYFGSLFFLEFYILISILLLKFGGQSE